MVVGVTRQVQMSAQWHAGHGIGAAREFVRRHLATNKMRISTTSGVQFEAVGGSRILTRLFGMLLVPRSCYPTLVRIVVQRLVVGTLVDVTIESRPQFYFFIYPYARQRYADHCEQ